MDIKFVDFAEIKTGIESRVEIVDFAEIKTGIKIRQEPSDAAAAAKGEAARIHCMVNAFRL